MNTTQATKYADDVRDDITEKMTALEADRNPSVLDDTYDAVREDLDNYPLELVWQKGAPFEVVITVGGPDARIVHDVRWNDWTLEVNWGGDNAVRRSEHITAMGEYFLELVSGDDA